MMFKNLSLFRFSPAVADDLSRLDEALAPHRLRPAGPLEMFTRGFVPPVAIGEDAPLTLAVRQFTGFAAGGEDKILPSSVVNDAVTLRVKQIGAEQGRAVGGRERKRIKEDVVTELLARAFTKGSRLGGYVDRSGGWLVLDTASRKSAENVITLVREALGSFPAVPLAPGEGPRVLMTGWLADGELLPEGLALGDECELRDPASTTGAIAITRRQDLDAEEVKEHLRNGKQVFKLGLVFDERIAFVLGEDLVVRKVKFLDGVIEEEAGNHEDAHTEASAQLALMTGEFDRLLTKLAEWFALPRPADGEAA